MIFDFSQPNKFLQKNGFSSIPAVLAESEVVRWLASYFTGNPGLSLDPQAKKWRDHKT